MRVHANLSIFIPHLGCPNHCSFCDQKIISGKVHAPSPAEVKELCARALQGNIGERFSKREIAFFGGSFTAIDREYMQALLKAASGFVGPGKFDGIRISTRPDAIDTEILSLLKQGKVTAIELGAQSMEERVLLKNRRGHTAEDVRRAAKLIRENGFSLGVQMMTGLYGDSSEGAFFTAQELIRLLPDTVRIYPTVVLAGTELDRLYRAGEYQPPGVEESVALCAALIELFEEAGVQVIRVGLHASEELAAKQTAGAYHPAFCELCRSRLMLEQILRGLKEMEQKEITLVIHPRDYSKVVGQHRKNLLFLQKKGYQIQVETDQEQPKGKIRIKGG